MHTKLGRHDRVLSVLGAYEDNDHVHIISPLCEQGNVLDFLRAQGTVTNVLVASRMRDILSALKLCHSRGKDSPCFQQIVVNPMLVSCLQLPHGSVDLVFS